MKIEEIIKFCIFTDFSANSLDKLLIMFVDIQLRIFTLKKEQLVFNKRLYVFGLEIQVGFHFVRYRVRDRERLKN